jgi:hypothetical protein
MAISLIVSRKWSGGNQTMKRWKLIPQADPAPKACNQGLIFSCGGAIWLGARRFLSQRKTNGFPFFREHPVVEDFLSTNPFSSGSGGDSFPPASPGRHGHEL